MRSFIRKFGVGVAGILVAGTMAVTGMGFLSGSADAGTTQTPTRPHKTSFTYVDKSCNSGAAGVIAVNALNCNDVEILTDVVDIVGVGSNSR